MCILIEYIILYGIIFHAYHYIRISVLTDPQRFSMHESMQGRILLLHRGLLLAGMLLGARRKEAPSILIRNKNRVSHKRRPIVKIFKVDFLNYFTFLIITEWIRNIFDF